MKLVRVFLCLLGILAVFVTGYGYGRWYAVQASVQAKAAGRRILYYVDPMHPAYKSDKPGVAPDCGMTLEPVYADEPAVAPASSGAKAPELPMGTIQVSPQTQQLIGVKYDTPTFGLSTKSIRAVGKVAPDEKRIVHVHTRVEAWIDKVFVDFTGKPVEENQPLLTLYSPDLLATQEEFLLALKSQELMKNSTLVDAAAQSRSLIAATRRRLQLWDLSEAQIDEIAQTRQPITNTTLYSPAMGYVMARNAFPKQRVTPDTELYTIVDLSKVWIMADFFEADASDIHLNQSVNISTSYGSARTFRGRIDYIQPQVDPVTRTVKVRIDVDNPGLFLKPDMFVEINLSVGMSRNLSVPAEAVLDSGITKTVFVDRGNGYLEPRQVETGERAGGRVEIVRGLKAGERIVSSGTFLIDSESQLKSAASGMENMPGMPGMKQPVSSGQTTPAVSPLPPAEKGPADDSIPGMQTPAKGHKQ